MNAKQECVNIFTTRYSLVIKRIVEAHADSIFTRILLYRIELICLKKD